MRKLMAVVARFLSLCAMLPVFTAGAAVQDTGALLIDRVWTADENGNDKSVFTPNDAIRYVAQIRNTYNHPVNMRIMFLASGPSWIGGAGNPAYRDVYKYIQRDVTIPGGIAIYYSPWTIPASAQPGKYGIVIDICWNESHVTTGSQCSGTDTLNVGSFSIPGTLATDITTFRKDGITPTSVTGPGEALFYKITVTNTDSTTNTSVVLTDTLPEEIFDLIAQPVRGGWQDIFTDHGECTKAGIWSHIIITCRLGNLTFGETATLYFTASIIVRDPLGRPIPPKDFSNKVLVKSDQQTSETSALVKSIVTKEEISCKDYNAFVDLASSVTDFVPVIGTAAAFIWEVVGEPFLQGDCQPKSFPEELDKAIKTGSKDLILIAFEGLGKRTGLKKIVKNLDTAEKLGDIYMKVMHNK